MTRYIDSTRCALIAKALAALPPSNRDTAEITEQLVRIFSDRAAPGAGFIMTIPGESA